MRAPVPPRWLIALVRIAAGPIADDVEGDLREWMARWAGESGRWLAWLKGVGVGLALLPRLLVANVRENGLQAPASWLDVRLALRLMVRQPGLTVTSVLALSVTMGLAITGYAVASDALLGKVDLPEADRLFVTRVIDVRQNVQTYPTLAEADLMRQAGSVESLALFTLLSLNLGRDEGLPLQVSAARVDGNAFPLAAVRPALGRLISEEDVRLDRNVVVISDQLWRNSFGGDPDVVGQIVQMDGTPSEIIGVAPAGFNFPVNQDAWVPLVIRPTSALAEGFPGLRMMGRRRDAVSLGEVDQEFLQLLAEAPAVEDRDVVAESVGYTRGFMSRGSDSVFTAMIVALVTLVLIAAANIANLILARTEARVGELAIRTALGASRIRITGQLFLEVLALTTASAVLALWGASLALGWMRALVTELPYWIDFRIAPTVVVFSFLLALLAALVAGAQPAWRATGRGLADGMRRARSGGFGRVSGAVIVAELALTVAMLAGSTAMGRGLIGYQATDYGLPDQQVLTAQIGFAIPMMEDQEAGAAALSAEVDRLKQTVQERLSSVPEIRSIGFSQGLPGAGGRPPGTIQVDGAEEFFPVHSLAADVDFYRALGVEPVAGEFHQDRLEEGTPGEVMVNMPFVEEVLGGRNAVGRRIRFVYGSEYGEWRRIVGVVPDIGLEPGDRSRAAAVHTPLGASNYLSVSIRTDGDPTAVAPALRAAVQAFSPGARLTRVQLLAQAGWEARALLQGLGGALLLLGLMALLLSSAGLYAILSFGVSRRTREIGVRVALGASSGAVMASILPRTLAQVLTGLVIGVGIGFAVLKFTVVLPISVPDAPILHLAIPAAVLLLGALAAVLRPSLRALSIRPSEALRQE